MSGIFLRWGIPALLTVVGGTAIAILTSGAAIPPDLKSRTASVLAGPQNAWAKVDFSMRDAVVTGTATDQQMIDNVLAKVASVHGVRSVTSNVVLAEFVSPFPFSAQVADGTVTLSGGLPDEKARAEVAALAGAGARDTMRLMSGAPERATWSAAVGYGFKYLKDFDRGEVKLDDLAVTIAGRAKSAAAYDELEQLAAQPLPGGVSLAGRAIEAALASPFEWRADYDGKRVAVSGFTPNQAFAEELTYAGIGSVPVSTRLVLASGAPEKFEDNARLLVENLLRLEQGSATISDAALTLTGAPADAATAESVRVAMTPSGATVTLAPPRVAEYWFSAEKSNGAIVLDGFVPEQADIDRLEAKSGVDASSLELARGAPERFVSAVDFVLDALGRLSDGHATIQGTAISVDGHASSVADFAAVVATMEQGAPQGLILASTDIKPPLASPFTWTAEKTAGGVFTLSGYVPSERTRLSLQQAVPDLASDSMTLADGNPPDFDIQATKALGVLALLDSGKVSFDGERWSLTGSVDTPQKAFLADSAFAKAGLRALGFAYDVALPPAAATVALPIIDPYVWRAQKSADGTVTFAGFVPADPLKRILAVRGGNRLVDSTTLGAGAPADFIPSVLAGLDALLAMPEGSLGFSAGSWSLTGAVETTADRLAIESALKGSIDTDRWQVAIQARDAAPVVSPFVWSAVKADDGSYTLSGYVNSDQMRRLVAVRAGNIAKDTTIPGSGEPAGFSEDALAGIEALALLRNGEVRFDGSKWSLSGQPNAAADAEAALGALAATSDKGAGWTTTLLAPVVAPEPPAVAEPVPAPAQVEPIAPEAAPSEPAVVPETPAATAPPADEPAVVAEPEAPVEPAAEAAVAEPVAVPEAAPAVRNFVFDASKPLGGQVGFMGIVPAEPMVRYLAVITGTEPSATLTVGTGLPADFIVNAEAGTRALATLSDGEFGLDGQTWVLTGHAESSAQRAAVLAELGALPSFGAWQADLTVLPPIVVCQQKVTAFAARNAIVFQSGSATIADASISALDELAGDLKACPEATVHVEGHTDSDGDEDANLALSVARAEAVVDALILRGVGADKLYAVGYGESLPIASNETRAGKQANRRIAFTILDEQH